MTVETWNDAPAEAGEGAWKADENKISGSWQDDSFDAGDFGDNTSKHANGDFTDGPHDGGCRNCGADGHFARDCPDKPANSGECYNCGQPGHSKAECTNERVEREFTGECRVCFQTGHRAADCPEKPAELCKICKVEGHKAAECSVNRMFAGLDIEDMPAEDAWKKLEEADKEKDVNDIKKALLTYAKAYPEATFEELEQVFRDASMNTYLIAKKQEVAETFTIVNLQGKQNQEFVVSIQFSPKPRRKRFEEGWPESPEENMTRLANAGWPMDGFVPKCTNCDQMGHNSKQCTEEKVEKEKLAITCANCNEEGHRARDCTQPRKTGKRGCKNCGQEGHIAKECPEPPNPENVTCKNCEQIGHFSRDCPLREPEICRNCQQEGHRAKDCTNERVMKCRNCDEIGHMSKECPKPTDWSRVKCSNCEELGHSYKRCTKPPKEKEDEGDAAGGGGDWDDGSGGAAATTNGGGDSWGNGGGDTAPASSGDGGW